MIAAFGAYIEQNLHISKIISNAIFAVICFLILSLDVKGLVKINKILVPLLIVVIFIIRSD